MARPSGHKAGKNVDPEDFFSRFTYVHTELLMFEIWWLCIKVFLSNTETFSYLEHVDFCVLGSKELMPFDIFRRVFIVTAYVRTTTHAKWCYWRIWYAPVWLIHCPVANLQLVKLCQILSRNYGIQKTFHLYLFRIY